MAITNRFAMVSESDWSPRVTRPRGFKCIDPALFSSAASHKATTPQRIGKETSKWAAHRMTTTVQKCKSKAIIEYFLVGDQKIGDEVQIDCQVAGRWRMKVAELNPATLSSRCRG